MDRNNTYFYISGFLSLFFFLIIILLIAVALNSSKVNNFAFNKDNYISVSIDMSSISSSVSKSRELDIDDLFNNIWTQGVKVEKEQAKKINRRVLQEINKKIKTSDKNIVDSISKIVQDVDSDKISNKSLKKSTASEVNEYLAKIQALVYNNFYPPQNSQGNSVKAVIELSSIGRVLDFRILNYSSSPSLNDECDKIKNRLMSVVFPKNPDKISGSYIITLTSEE